LSHLQLIVFSIVLVFLILFSAFFAISETALMAVNRYRLRHKAKLKKSYAILILKLLKRPDRLLGMVLIGNNLANIFASSIATFLAMHYFSDRGVVLTTIILTLLILIFAEVAPKTLAALYPEQVSRWVVFPVKVLLSIFYPFVWFINSIANGLLHLLGVNTSDAAVESFSREELRSVVYDMAGRISRRHQSMLLGILDLNKMMVDDVMVPLHEISGIDIDEPWEIVEKKIAASQHDWLPVYQENINQVVGILHLRDLMPNLVAGNSLTIEVLKQKLQEPYFVPQGIQLNVQLMNFQQQRQRIALVVDEYGDVQGLVTLVGILEEIVGQFTTNIVGTSRVEAQANGSYLVDGAITVRELNRITKWQLPTQGPRTVNGLIIEYLEALPNAGTCVRISGYPIEIIHVKENRVELAQIFPKMLKNIPIE
jgi:Mg2+/Co2+ transporter CorB